MEKEIKIFCPNNWQDYQMLDTGEGEKLEKFGSYVLVRPLETAYWNKTLSKDEWDKADGKFLSSKTGAKAGWKFREKIPEFQMEYQGIKFKAKPTPFRHLGFFPEQASHWEFIEKTIKNSSGNSLPIKFLNLFGYTGIASLFALRAGAEVTHLDASKDSVDWAKQNQKISGLENLPMRVIVDDAIKFLEREERRGNKYDAIIMDPPKFGRGPKGETWEFEKDFPRLLSLARKVLSDNPVLIIVTSYSVDSSSLPIRYALAEMMKDFGGKIESGELSLPEKTNKRLIALANTAVWTKD